MENLSLNHCDVSTVQESIGIDNSVCSYSFKKRKPLPGAYPRKFSPYLMISESTTRAVPLSRAEIKKDLNDIHEAMAKEFSSHYYEESGTSPRNEKCVEPPCKKSSMPLKNQRRAPRRPYFSSIQAPTTEAEERRQLRAALKASQLEAECGMDENGSRMRSWDRTSNICSIQQDYDGAKTLRRICQGNVLRTG